MSEARKKEVLALSIDIKDVEVEGLYTKPRTWGVYCIIGPAPGDRQFRFGNHPVREWELRREFNMSKVSLEALFKDRSLAKELKSILNY